MQNRYFGDVGDFSKYGMLRVLLKSGLKVGINWYLFPDQGHNKDGKHTAYLVNDTHELRNCDVFLYDFLKKSISGKRHISIIENSELLGSTIYYSKSLEVANNAFWKARSH